MWRFFLMILAVLILLSMASYVLTLFLRLQKQKKLLHQAKQERSQRVIESIEIIAKAMLTEQCNPSEGVLRLKPLLDVLGKKLALFPAMWELYQVVEDMPILDARQGLKRNERMKLDLEREAKEAELETKIKSELQQLLEEIQHFKQELK